MKAIIEIIKEEIEKGNKLVNQANYKSHVEHGFHIEAWLGEVPEIGDVLSNGQQEMKVVEYLVSDQNDIGLKMDAGMLVPASQVKSMISEKIIWVK